MDHNLACTEAIIRIRRRDNDAAAAVFHRFIERLLTLAQGRLHRQLRSRLDPEDVVQSVFHSFFRRCADGHFTLAGWDNVWHVLACITIRKCDRQNRRLGRKIAHTDAPNDSVLQAAIDREPTPEEATVLLDTLEELMSDLPPRERDILTLRLQGYSTRDIGSNLGCTVRKVQRILHQTRLRLERMDDS